MNSNKWVSLYDPYSHPFKTPSWAYLFELANKRFDFDVMTFVAKDIWGEVNVYYRIFDAMYVRR
jgi:hypothetical protein